MKVIESHKLIIKQMKNALGESLFETKDLQINVFSGLKPICACLLNSFSQL